MITAAILLATVGVADLVRPHDRPASPRIVAAALAAGTLTAVLLGWGTGVSVWLVPVVVLVLAGWLFSTPQAALMPRLVPLLGLGLAVLTALAAPPAHVSEGAWLPRWFEGLAVPALAGTSFESFLLAAACLIFLVNSANVVVRIALTLAGDGVAQTEQQLRGGRVLGPLERLFVFSLAVGGAYTALAAVVAAKGILRFPEISRHDPHGYKAEYVLVGSFVSWALALVFVPLF